MDIATCGHNRLRFRQNDTTLELAGLEFAAMHVIRFARSGFRHTANARRASLVPAPGKAESVALRRRAYCPTTAGVIDDHAP